jgi:hypothetical protein
VNGAGAIRFSFAVITRIKAHPLFEGSTHFVNNQTILAIKHISGGQLRITAHSSAAEQSAPPQGGASQGILIKNMRLLLKGKRFSHLALRPIHDMTGIVTETIQLPAIYLCIQ